MLQPIVTILSNNDDDHLVGSSATLSGFVRPNGQAVICEFFNAVTGAAIGNVTSGPATSGNQWGIVFDISGVSNTQAIFRVFFLGQVNGVNNEMLSDEVFLFVN
jgi:hypothetical protein